MQPNRLEHPGDEQLSGFVLGTLEPAEIDAVEQHLSCCETCCDSLKQFNEDTFVSLVRESRRPPAEEIAGATLTLPGVPTQSDGVGQPFDIPAELATHPRYRIVELIGRGGMGTVYRAEHRLMQRIVALKVINPKLVASKTAVERFRREVQAAARLDHPNIVTAYDAEQAGNVHFLVMEYANGIDLQKVLEQRGPLPEREACEYVRQAALGLQHAHENGMVHRDIKPHNLMVVSGRGISVESKGAQAIDPPHPAPHNSSTIHPSPTHPSPLTTHQIKILDFGLAVLSGEVAPSATGESTLDGRASDLTQVGAAMGTPDYMAPEQGRDARSADIRADIYSLGCTLFTLLTGQVPFPAGTPFEKIEAHIERAPPPIAELRNDISPALVKVLDRMMAKDPAQRYQTPAEVATALTPFALLPDLARRRRSSRRSIVAALAAAVLVTLFGVIYVSTDKGQLKIESAVDDAQIIVSKGGKEIEVIDLKCGSTVKRLPSGDYEVKLKGDRTDVKLDRGGFVIRRSGSEVVKVSAVPAVADASRDQELLQGEWQPVRVELNGQEASPEFLKKQRFPVKLIFKGNQWGAVTPDDTQYESTFTLYPDKQPKGIDIAGSLFRGTSNARGIYKLEGDTATLCLVEMNQPRPTEFTTKDNPAYIMIVARRISAKGDRIARKRPTPTDEIAPKHREAINKGLAFLVKAQHADGHWAANGGQYPVAMTALAGMALLMEGSTIHDGTYSESIRKAVEWLISQSQANGLLVDPKSQVEMNRYMFGHGYAMLLLATVYAQEDEGERRVKLHKILTKAIDFTLAAQTHRGGWGYVAAAEGGNFDEGATTIVQLQGLRAARNAGIVVPRKTIDASYLRRSTGPNGGVVYSITNPDQSERPALAAAALSAGEFDSDLAKKWLKFCQQSLPLNDRQRLGFDEFTHYYYAQGIYFLGEKGYEKLFPESKPAERLTWSKYRAAMFDSIVAKQSADGSWPGPLVGPVYSTACYLTVLQLDNAALPIYQR